MNAIKIIEAIKKSLMWRMLIAIQKWLMIASSIFVVLIMCAVVVLRYVFRSDLYGIEEIVIIAAFWLYFMGSSYGVYEKSHVKADILPQMMSEKNQAFLSVIINLIVAGLCILFTYWSIDMITHCLKYMPRTTGLRIPIVVSQFSIFVGYFLMSIYSVIYFLESLFGFIELRGD
jgi:TRAP-type C4-dicarboxylate transport system permease small subunit